MEKKYVIWEVKGGLGKNVAATSLIKSLSEKYPDRDLILVCSYPDIFLNFREIKRVFDVENLSYFYEDYIENKDTIIFKSEPYEQTNHILRKQSLIKTWCDILDLKYSSQLPEIKFNYPQSLQSYTTWSRSKPILLLQTTGGPFPLPFPPNSPPPLPPYNWSRDLPYEIALQVITKYSSEYHIIHLTRPNGYQLPGVDERIEEELPKMMLFSLVEASQKRILIDSCLQHVAAGLGLPSIVFWITTSPTVFGYDLHNNILANFPHRANQLIKSYDFDYQFSHNDHECPFNSIDEIFDLNKTYQII
jgi:hypothetical protein